MFQNTGRTDDTLLVRLRTGDETAFATLVDSLHGRLLDFAKRFTSSPALAEDIVQETWLAVIRGLRGFEGRSSLQTWIFSILVRRARTLSAREARQTARWVQREDSTKGAPALEWELGHGRIGLWEESPVPWVIEDPATIFQSRETLEVLEGALAQLPGLQRQVVLLRDVEDISATDVCNILDLSETNQRVLLHRGRSRIRRALDNYLRDGTKPPLQPRPGTARASVASSASSSDGSLRIREKQS